MKFKLKSWSEFEIGEPEVYPVLRAYRTDVESSPLVVMFTGPTEGVVLNSGTKNESANMRVVLFTPISQQPGLIVKLKCHNLGWPLQGFPLEKD